MLYFDAFLTMMDQGGPVMWVIFWVAWLAFILLVDRALRLRAWIKSAQVEQNGFKTDSLYQPPKPNGYSTSPIAMLYHALDWKEIRDLSDLDKQINAHLPEIMPKVSAVLPTIAVIASLLPMLGLLGTVLGMIQVFDVIATQGTGDPRLMADGIAQALLTTAGGLIIAIPVIFFHHLLAKQLHLLLSMVEQSIHLMRKRGDFGQVDRHE